MPKLPDYTALPQVQPSPSGRIASYSTAGFTTDALGQALQHIGSELQGFGADQKRKADTLQSAEATADFSIGVDRLFSEKSQQQDYQSAGREFREEGNALLEQQRGRFSDRQQGEVFIQRHRATVESHALQLEKHAFVRRKQDYNAERDEAIDEMGRQALANPDPAYREQKLKIISDDIEARRQGGYLTPAEARAKGRAFVEKYRKAYRDDWIQRDPEGYLKATEEVAPSEGLRSRAPPENRVNQLQSGVRNQPISGDLEKQLNTAAQIAGVQVDVVSGGQPASGPNRTGSHRHDLGGAADVKLFEVVDGKKRYLNQNDPADRERISAFVTFAVASGAQGVGAGSNYMGPETLHIGGGTPATWGAGGRGSAAPAWLQEAYNAGRKGVDIGAVIDASQQQAKPAAPLPSRTASLQIPGIGAAELYGTSSDDQKHLQGMLGMTLGFAAPTIKAAPGAPMKGDQPYIELPNGWGRVVIPGATPEQLKAHHERLENAKVMPGTKLVLPGEQKNAPGDNKLPAGAQLTQAGGDLTLPGARPRTGTPIDHLTPDEIIQGRTRAQAEIRARQADQERLRVRTEHEAKQRSDAAEKEIVRQAIEQPNALSARDVVNNKDLTPAAMEKMIRFVERENRPDPLARVSNQTSIDLLDRMRRPEGDPQRITDTNPIFDARIAGKLTKGDFSDLIKQFNDMRSPEGESLARRQGEFFKAVEPMIDKSLTSFDTTGASRQKFYIFQKDAQRKVDEYRKAGKNPYDLFDPSKPDYLGKPEVVAPYQRSLQDILRDQTAPTLAPTPPVQAPGGIPARLPNETISDWMARTGRGLIPSQSRPEVPLSR